MIHSARERGGAPALARAPGSWPLIGRAAELEVLDRALRDRAGSVVAGAPGVGKTRLLREVEARAIAEGAHVERIVASRSAASIPLGAFAHIRPETVAPMPGATPLGAVRDQLVRRAGERQLVLIVDDAHALDPSSAALVHQLAASREAVVMVAVRAREPAPDAIVALWKDDLCERVEIQPLSRTEVGRLLAAVLDGPVESAAVHALWDSTRGNVMFLRELVSNGLDSGALLPHDGLWHWHRPPHLAPRLVELLAENLATLEDDERGVLELLALGEPLDWEVLTTLTSAAAAEALVARRLIDTDPATGAGGARGAVLARVAHPLIGEVLHDGMPISRRRRLLVELADIVEARNDSDHELLRVVTWRLDAGVAIEPAQLAAAARACIYADAALSERLALEARAAGAGFAAIDVLAQVYEFWQRADETEQLLAAVDLATLSAAERVRHTVLRANNLTWGIGAPDDAVALLERTAAQTDDGPGRRQLESHVPPMLLFAGRVRDAVDRAASVIDDPEATAVQRLDAYLGALPSLAAMGRAETMLARIPEAAALAPQCTDELPVALGQLASFVTLAQQWLGHLDAAEAIMRGAFEDGIARDVPLVRGGAALRLGQVALWRGDADTARELLFESVAALAQSDAGFRAWAAQTLRMACALVGDLDGAADAHVRAEQSLVFPLYESERFRADAWVAAAEGRLSAACELAAAGAEWSREHDHLIQVLVLSWDRARFGDPVSAEPVIVEIAPVIEGPLARVLPRAVTALAADDAVGLDDASSELEQLGYVLFAAECARAAARAHSRRGLRAREAASDARADALAARCGGARTPLLDGRGAAVALTRREREIAGIAATGHTDAEIADQLGVSVRTVESHLHRIYGKLGVTSRQELGPVLGTEPEKRVPRY